MKTLLLLRHAKSSWKDPSLSDHDRPLNKRGERDAPQVGEHLEREGLVPEHIVTSTARRALDTASLVCAACAFDGRLVTEDALYHADVETFVTVLRQVPDECRCVLLVGHNPDIEDLLETLTGTWERLPTAALVQIELPIETWREVVADGSGRVVLTRRPREAS